MIKVELNKPLKKDKYPYLAKYTDSNDRYYIALFVGKEDEETVEGAVIVNPWNIVSNNARYFNEKKFEPYEGTITISNE